MQNLDWLQLVLFIGALVLITKPMELYLVQVLDVNGRTWFDRVVKPLERLTYRLLSVDPNKEQDWKQFTFAMLIFSLVSALFTYAILRWQQWLPLNFQKFDSLTPHLTFNTSAIFKNDCLEVYLATRTVKVKGRQVKLTATEYALLQLFISHAGKVLTHRQILKEVWGPTYVEQTHYLRVYMTHLREKLEEIPAEPAMLITESGVGYRLMVR
jgi:DNA-binding response OmpR family regulator